MPPVTGQPKVVIVGAGFGGLAGAKALKDAPVSVTLIDRKNHHLFQPLLYQVATAGLNPSDIAQPIRRIIRKQQNCEVSLGNVSEIDINSQTVNVDGQSIDFDYLILATGATHAYFGNDHWAEHAPGLKSLEDALDIRRRILSAFEQAETTTDNPDLVRQLMTFVVVGAGPTGVELAGAVSEVATKTLKNDFRKIDTTKSQVILVEAGERVLAGFPEKLSASAHKQLESLGVEVQLKTSVTNITAERVETSNGDIPTATVLWGAGVAASPLGAQLGCELDRAGRVKIRDDLTIPNHSNIFVIGDLALLTQDGNQVPGIAPAAQQGGEHAAHSIEADLDNKKRPTFNYKNKGSLATIGRSSAVANLGPRFQFGGYFAWLIWWVVHIWSLIDFRSKGRVMLSWGWQYLTSRREARLITDPQRDSKPNEQSLH